MSTSPSVPHPENARQYALISRGEAVILENEPSADALPSNTTRSDEEQCCREELLELYEAYAEAFPNVALQHENDERDRLLRAVSAASHAVHLNPTKEKKSSWFGGLFGGTKTSTQDKSRKGNSSLPFDDTVEDDHRLKYTDIGCPEEDWMLGTEFSLDPAIVPDEAHSAARWHMICSRCKTPNVARTSWETAGSSCLVVVGLGSLVEFQKRPPSSNTKGGDDDETGTPQHTSDRQHLIDYASTRIHPKNWHASKARAALVGPNLLVLSWGLDSTVMFYRRICSGEDDIISWEAVAYFGATDAVKESLADVFLEEGSNDGGPLLGVTDILPVALEIPNSCPAVTLCVARMGGYVELVPLPPQMWYGPELPAIKQRRKAPKRKLNEHYVVGKLPDLASNRRSGIVSITTSEYHGDVMGLESFRTSVNSTAASSSSTWDQALYPNAPPAEHVIAAFGAEQRTGRQIVSFWSLSTLLSESGSVSGGFSINVAFAYAIDVVNVGPDVTLFASPKILRHWRKPRQVELCESFTSHSSATTNGTTTASTQRVTTLSVPAPIVGLRFLVSKDGLSVRAAILDWNGGASALDCNALEKFSSHSLSREEYNALREDSNSDSMPLLVKAVATRSQVMQKLLACCQDEQRDPFSATNLEWFSPNNDGSCSGLAFVSGNPCSFALVCSSDLNLTDEKDASSFTSTFIPCLKHGTIALSRWGGRTNTLYIIIQSASTKERGSPVLSFCSLQELSGADIVQSFFQAHLFREAMNAAVSLTGEEKKTLSRVLETCKKNLWESELDFKVFESINDDVYVVQEALHLSRFRNQSREPAVQRGDIDLFRSVCRYAFTRTKSIRLGASLEIAKNVDEVTEIKTELQRRLLLAGTYEVLCNFFESAQSPLQFFQNFLNAPIADLAISFARSSHIVPLSIILYRHQYQLQPLLCNILQEIPLSTAPWHYQHLLPVFHKELSDTTNKVSKFMARADPAAIYDMSDMNEYLTFQFGFHAVIDEADEALVMENPVDFHAEDGCTRSFLEKWYFMRSFAIHRFVSNMCYTVNFTRFALVGLNVSTEAATSSASSVTKIHRLLQFAESIRNVQVGSHEVKLLTTLSSLEPDGFDVMDTKDVVGLILNCKNDSVDLVARYNQYLLPLMKERLSGCQHNGLEYEIDQAITQFCLCFVNDCEGAGNTELLDAFSVCTKICWLSRTSIPRPSRIVKSKSVLATLVFSIVYETARIGCTRNLTFPIQREWIDRLWTVYETLPDKLPHEKDPDGDLERLMINVDHLFLSLTLVDLVASWPGTNPLSLLRDLGPLTEPASESSLTIPCSIGEKAIVLLCRAFCEEIDGKGQNSNKAFSFKELLSVLLDDVDRINDLCFHGKLPLKNLYSKLLFRPLLNMNEIAIISLFLTFAKPSVVDTESMSKDVLLYLNDAIYGPNRSNVGNSNLSSAIECQDVLVKLLPGIGLEFQSIRQYLEVAHLIDSTLLVGTRDNLRPEQIRQMLPLDVVDFVLERNPKAIVTNCNQWENPAWAKQANESIRTYHAHDRNRAMESNVRDASQHPPIPGQMMYHLANLLHLDSTSAIIAVKSIVIHYAVVSHLFGAAAAIGRTMVATTDVANVEQIVVLDVVAKIVSQQDYDDTATKRELCSMILNKFSGISKPTSTSFYTILMVWSECSRQDKILTEKPDGSMFAVGLFFRDTFNEYRIHLGEIFLTLYEQVSDASIDDRLVAALARYSFFWCIERSTRTFLHPIGPLQECATETILLLAVSLVNHIRDRVVAKTSINEISRVLGDQHALAKKALESSPHSNWIKPDPTIVQSLVGRGYSECGARRAASMTKNSGVREALQWSVMHSLDSGFDDPMVEISSLKTLHIDLQNSKNLKNSVATIDKINKGILSIQDFLQNMHPHMNALDNERYSQNKDLSKASNSSNVFSNGRKLSELVCAQTLPSSVTPTTDMGYESIVSSDVGFSQLTIETPSIRISNSAHVTHTLNNPKTAPLRSNSIPKISTVRLHTIRTNVVVPSPNRTTLLKAGQAAFQSAKAVSSPSNEDRKKLIEEGRLLLQRARSAMQSAPSTPSHHTDYVASEEAGVPPAANDVALDHSKPDEWDFDDDLDV